MAHNNSVPSLWLQQITFTSCVCDYGALQAAVVHVGAGKGICMNVLGKMQRSSFNGVSTDEIKNDRLVLKWMVATSRAFKYASFHSTQEIIYTYTVCISITRLQ